MKQFVCIIIIALCAALPAGAQNFLDQLRKKQVGQGTVTVSQSKEIDELVNGKKTVRQEGNNVTPLPAGNGKDNNEQKNAATHDKLASTNGKEGTGHEANGNTHAEEKKETAHREAAHAPENSEEEAEAPAVDMRKKVMRGSYKVTGYRVQAYAGGNSRNDRQKAEQIGNAIKMKYPTQPVYVHFYSPRWICRVGNFRSYEEAARMLEQVRAMGYKSAIVVKGKITVQN